MQKFLHPALCLQEVLWRALDNYNTQQTTNKKHQALPTAAAFPRHCLVCWSDVGTGSRVAVAQEEDGQRLERS